MQDTETIISLLQSIDLTLRSMYITFIIFLVMHVLFRIISNFLAD